MTDLRHIAQLLHEAGVTEGLGLTALATWLRRRIADAERGRARTRSGRGGSSPTPRRCRC